MRRNKRGRRRQLARPFAYGRGHLLGKQAGAVAEALRRRGVTAHVNPSWSGRSLLVQVADPAAHMGYLAAHADALADALLADSVSISSGLHDFIVAPEWRGLDDSAETEDEAAWPPTGSAERSPSEPPTPEVASPGVSAVATLEAFIHGYKMGRLAGVLGDLRHYLVLGGPRDDGGFELRLPAGCNGDAVRAQLRDWSAVIAEALGINTCHIGGVGRRITITPVLLPPSVAAQAA